MSEQTPLTIRLSPADNVVVARAELLPGAPIAGTNVTCVDRIPRSHKVTVVPVAKGEAIRKYDQVIGFATTDIEPGRHVHVHNVEMHDFVRDYAFGADTRPTAYVP
jgi:altronate hydrolase